MQTCLLPSLPVICMMRIRGVLFQKNKARSGKKEGRTADRRSLDYLYRYGENGLFGKRGLSFADGQVAGYI